MMCCELHSSVGLRGFDPCVVDLSPLSTLVGAMGAGAIPARIKSTYRQG